MFLMNGPISKLDYIGGNQIAVLHNGPETYSAMLEAISSAKKSIYIANFCMQSGKVFARFLPALIDKANGGVKIFILADHYGSRDMDPLHIERLRHAGAMWTWYQPLNFLNPVKYNHHLHKKIMIIDNRIAFTGGIGIADFWNTKSKTYPKLWRDTHFAIAGPIITQIYEAFKSSWIKFSDEHLPEITTPKERTSNVLIAKIDSFSRDNQLTQVGEHFLKLITDAKKSITITTAYFGPTKDIHEALMAAASRGVRVRILINGPYTTHKIAQRAGRHQYQSLLDSGVELYEYQPTKIHAKLVVVDNKYVSLGSANLNYRTLKHDDELNLCVNNTKLAEELTKQFDLDLRQSIKIDAKTWRKRSIFQKVSQSTASLARWVF